MAYSAGMNGPISRRDFVGTAGLAFALTPGAAALGQGVAPPSGKLPAPGAGVAPVVVTSANGLRAAAKAYEMLGAGEDPLDACIEGVRIIEDDPKDNSVGYGGLPNEEGVVELDASVMHGPSHRAGAVAALRNIKNPAAVAREVARRTDHVLLVGEGALKFAVKMGFQEENLLTPESHKAWLKWKSAMSREDKWLQPDEFDLPTKLDAKGEPLSRMPFDFDRHDPHALALAAHGVPHTTGTVHCSALTKSGDLAGCTSTSGLSWKIPGRVGDSPLIGAGCYTDNDVGSAGATGRGEACIQISGARFIVARMAMGDTPAEACMAALKMVVDKTTAPRLLGRKARPAFSLTFYALRKDGLYGSATMHQRKKDAKPDSWEARFAVADARGARLEESPFLFEAD